jgi:hypothetical protein
MALSIGRTAPRVIALALAGVVAGCASGPRSAADCGLQFRPGSVFLASLGTGEASDLPTGPDCAALAPPAASEPASPTVDKTVPAAESEAPQFWLEVGPRPFVPSG